MSADIEWLPDYCPSWCDGQHAEALVEHGDWESAQRHMAFGHGGYLHDVLNPISKRVVRSGGASWELSIQQTPLPERGFADIPTVDMAVRDAGRQVIDLCQTSGEARTLARQLVMMADRIDL